MKYHRLPQAYYLADRILRLPDRITIDPAVRSGKPCVRGTRLTVRDVLGILASGRSEAELFKGFPQLCREDVLACLTFAEDVFAYLTLEAEQVN